jgi:hypothetical protein
LSKVIFTEIAMRGTRIGTGSMPPLKGYKVPQWGLEELPEDAGLFVGYGQSSLITPYMQQECYTRELEPLIYKAAILENRYLKAVFLPEMGGKLWQLYDKAAGRDLLLTNDVVRPCNLALRNAWCSGGVEWNIGQTGHSPFTCAPLHTAVIAGDTDILRMYEYERVRRVVYQMDFYLPEDSRYLHCRMRIANNNNTAVPMYWWSNIAVPEKKDNRIVGSSDKAYFYSPDPVRGKQYLHIKEVPYPSEAGGDSSYPVNMERSGDYFLQAPAGENPYICSLDEKGYGLLQTSTSRLRGRKIFAWGKVSGGRHWQKYLTDKSGPYVEIQAGLGQVQAECLPMPPRTVWEWMELYGAIQIDGAQAHGHYSGARQAVRQYMDSCPECRDLERELADTRESVALKPARLVFPGSGFAALENDVRRRFGQPPLPSHLEYPDGDAEQAPWRELLETGKVTPPPEEEPPVSYMNQPEWAQLLEQAEGEGNGNWWTMLQLGVIAYGHDEPETARQKFACSLARKSNPWALAAAAMASHRLGDCESAADYAARAVEACPEDVFVRRSMWNILLECGRFDQLIHQAVRTVPQPLTDSRCCFFLARAYLEKEMPEEAEALLYRDGGLEIPDIREGEISITKLWFELENKKERRRGGTLAPDSNPPEIFDFRMD